MNEQLPTVIITADGAARGNPGPGGWAALLEANGRQQLLHGEGPERTTNNAMEIYAVVRGLAALKRPCVVRLRLDSQYVLNGLERLRRTSALPEKNRELWAQLRDAIQPHQISTEWVRGHNGDPRNEQVDRAANAASNRAFLAQEQANTPAPTTGDTWTLALLSPASDRPVRWALEAGIATRSGEVAVRGVTQPTAMYQALLAGVTAASQLPGANAATLRIVSNYELIVKQGRGEWKVKNPAQRELAQDVERMRSKLGGARFDFAPTGEVEALVRK